MGKYESLYKQRSLQRKSEIEAQEVAQLQAKPNININSKRISRNKQPNRFIKASEEYKEMKKNKLAQAEQEKQKRQIQELAEVTAKPNISNRIKTQTNFVCCSTERQPENQEREQLHKAMSANTIGKHPQTFTSASRNQSEKIEDRLLREGERAKQRRRKQQEDYFKTTMGGNRKIVESIDYK